MIGGKNNVKSSNISFGFNIHIVSINIKDYFLNAEYRWRTRGRDDVDDCSCRNCIL